MEEIALLDVSAVLGLFAMVTLTVNVLLGMLLSTGYKAQPLWKKLPPWAKKIDVNTIHNWTAYLALLLVLLHPLFLVLDKTTKFTWIDIIYPVNAPKQKLFVVMGTLAMLALITVIITTQKKIKRKISFRAWKNIHLISYATAMLFIVHGLIMDPLLKDRPTDWLDGEKLLVEGCCIILVAATIARIQYHYKKAAQMRAKKGVVI